MVSVYIPIHPYKCAIGIPRDRLACSSWRAAADPPGRSFLSMATNREWIFKSRQGGGSQAGCILGLCAVHIWLVVWTINFIFPYIGNVIIPIDVHMFQRGGPTTNQAWYGKLNETDYFRAQALKIRWWLMVTGVMPLGHTRCNLVNLGWKMDGNQIAKVGARSVS